MAAALIRVYNLADQARSLLEELSAKNYPAGLGVDYTFYPSLLRYKVKGHIKHAGTSEPLGDMVSKVMEVDSVKTWYNDDDWIDDRYKRLGADIGARQVERSQQDIQSAMWSWALKSGVREHVEAVLKELLPSDVAKPARYGVKFDLYTNRTLPNWHQDWDHGYALFVGLMNISRDGDVEIPIKGTEILDFRDQARGDFGGAYDMSSPTRKALMRSLGYEEFESLSFHQTSEDQPFGEIRWFNDAVLVHRTPPYGANALSGQQYVLRAINRTFGTADGKVLIEIPDNKLLASMKDESRYGLDDRKKALGPDGEPRKRALLRITIRQAKKSER